MDENCLKLDDFLFMDENLFVGEKISWMNY